MHLLQEKSTTTKATEAEHVQPKNLAVEDRTSAEPQTTFGITFTKDLPLFEAFGTYVIYI